MARAPGGRGWEGNISRTGDAGLTLSVSAAGWAANLDFPLGHSVDRVKNLQLFPRRLCSEAAEQRSRGRRIPVKIVFLMGPQP